MDFFNKLFGKNKTEASSPDDTKFPFVYINQDGSARELSPNEQTYLTTEFHGADGARPYIKVNYKSSDGWGSQSGYIERRRLPKGLEIAQVNPNYDAAVNEFDKDVSNSILGVHRAVGDIITTNPDGSITAMKNPEISAKESYERMKAYQLEQQKLREALAKV